MALVPGEITPVNVTQLSTWQENEDLYQAAHAVDKDLSTWSITAIDGVQWLKLEFNATYSIDQITIYHFFYTNWYDPNEYCVQSESNYREWKDHQSNVDIAVYQGDELQASCGTLLLTYGLEQADQIYTFNCTASGDTVLLSKSGQILVTEIVVTGRTSGITYKTDGDLSPGRV